MELIWLLRLKQYHDIKVWKETQTWQQITPGRGEWGGGAGAAASLQPAA